MRDTDDLLSTFGVALAPSGSVILADLYKAENGYVHHSTVPVAVTALALANTPTFSLESSTSIARRLFPKTRLRDLVAKRPGMDGREIVAFAAVCDAGPLPTSCAAWPQAFVAQLLHVIDAYDLHSLFFRDQGHPACNNIDVRPVGYTWGEVDLQGVAAFRRAYRAMPAERQMMAATVMWLYRSNDKTWMQRIPCAWHAADAVETLKATGTLRDWARLVALYPGW